MRCNNHDVSVRTLRRFFGFGEGFVKNKQVTPSSQQRWVGGVSSAAAQGIAPHIVRDPVDVDAWANDRSQMIVPKFWNGKPGWDVEKISIDCMPVRKIFLVKLVFPLFMVVCQMIFADPVNSVA